MCGLRAPIAVRQVLMGVPDDVKIVVACPTGCLEVSTTIYPILPGTAPISTVPLKCCRYFKRVETATVPSKEQGQIEDEYRFIAFGGDGELMILVFNPFRCFGKGTPPYLRLLQQ